MKMGCQIGIFGEPHIPLLDAINRVSQHKVKGLECFVNQIAPHYEDATAFSALLQKAGVELSGVYYSNEILLDQAKAAETCQEVSTICQFLNKVGCHFLVVNGGIHKTDAKATFTNEDVKQLASIFNRIGAETAKHQVQAVFHPHWGCMIETTDDVDRLLAAGLDKKAVGLCVHAVHQVHVGADPYPMFEKHADWVKYVHIGDLDENKGGALFGHGILDQKRLMNPIFRAGYNGWIIIESGVTGVSPETYTDKALEYIQTEWPNLKWE